MLQYSTVEPGTLELLKRLMNEPELKDFNLVGGTALSLYFGHRKSIDLDLFSSSDFDTQQLISSLEARFGNFAFINKPNPVGLFSFIDEIKVDFVRHHHHKLIGPLHIEDEIRLVSIPDIAAMKVAAILKRGVKKDFWDLDELLNHYSVSELMGFYNSKYPSQQLLISVPQALVYFTDAEDSEDPISLKKQTWKAVKRNLQKKISAYLR